jgi:penicillin amidase
MKWIKRLLGTLAVLLLLALGAGWVYSQRVLPQVHGELRLPGLNGEVMIDRDEHGIPTIRAQNQNDLAYGLGVAHAQDRLWQMETHRRIGSGRLAEAFGPKAVDTDRVLRALGVRQAAEAQWAQTQGEARELLLAYSRGVNATVQHAMRARPPEFVLLGLQPEDWTPVDSIAWTIMMAWDLGANWNMELLRLRLAINPKNALPKARIDDVLPPYPGEQPLPSMDYAAFYKGLQLNQKTAAKASLADMADRLMAAAPPSGIEGEGSNNWVLSGARTTTGMPLLASDPHLKLSTPALWYFARLEMPGLKVAGATLPGMPTVVMGQNDHIAWGFTNTGPDVQDLYLEHVKPDDATQYQTPDGWAKFATRTETIKVKGGADVAFTVRRTRHGPVISDAGLADDVLGAKPSHVLALRWTALDADVDTFNTSLRMNRATSVASFIEATRGWVAPMQNMVVADRAGHIGLVAPGRIPLRKPENDLHGLAPAPGWDARYDWAGWLPFEALWQQQDPPAGFIATANQRVVPPDYPHFLTSNWALPYRHQRIVQMIEAQPKHSQADLRNMQADVKSLGAPRLLPWLLKAKASHPLAAAAAKQLSGFDGTMAADKAAPLIYWAWLRHLGRHVLADEMGTELYDRTLATRGYADTLERVLERNDAWWCDDKATTAAETCATQADAALTDALTELQALQGTDPAQWRWGQAHQARSEHRPFSNVKLLAKWFEVRTPIGGDTYTVNVARVGLRPDAATGELYLDEHGPSLRGLYDLADPSKSQIIHSTGQSGIPWSPLYRSFAGRWAGVEYVPLWVGVGQVLVVKGR